MLKAYLLAAVLGLSISATPALAAPGDANDTAAAQQGDIVPSDGSSTGASSGTSGSGEPLSPGEAANNPSNAAADSAGEQPPAGGGDPSRAWPTNRAKE